MPRWRGVGIRLAGAVGLRRAINRRTPPGPLSQPANDVQRGRQAATVDQPVVVFLIGMRIHRLSAIRSWLPAFRAMQRMRRELDAHPELGLLHTEQYLAVQGAMLCQYWRSIEDLERFTHGRDLPHLPAWREFNRRAREGSPAFGLWHESYVIASDRTEAIYTDMPPTGLGAAVGLSPARGARLTAARRMGRTPSSDAPPFTDYADHDGVEAPHR